MDYYVGVDPDNTHKRIDRVCNVLNHPGIYRILTGKQIHFDFDDQMKSANMIIFPCKSTSVLWFFMDDAHGSFHPASWA
jgi:hypothetical protein